MDHKDNAGTPAVALRLLAALDDYLRELEDPAAAPVAADCQLPGHAFGKLQALAARLPFTSAAWLEVFISRAEFAHADRAGLRGEAAQAYLAQCLERHLEALHRMRLACMEWQREA